MVAYSLHLLPSKVTSFQGSALERTATSGSAATAPRSDGQCVSQLFADTDACIFAMLSVLAALFDLLVLATTDSPPVATTGPKGGTTNIPRNRCHSWGGSTGV